MELQDENEELLRGIIALMAQEGVAPTKTRLMKFLYLADLHHARFNNGRTLTQWTWRVDSFGPLSTEGLSCIDRGVQEGWLFTQPVSVDEVEDTSNRATFYRLGSAEVVRDAVNCVPAGISGQMRRWIKKYGHETNRLLAFVYGNTEPMEDARPGDVLDFGVARPPGPGRPIQDAPLSAKQKKRMAELIGRIRKGYEEKRAAADRVPNGPYDTEYYQGVPEEDGVVPGEIELHFES